ncbi:MAG TPA: class I SAM-dependent methyltransferase [Steroidobacteraceae bacterium]|nr:class I SAM-dependent methyltransferase [Steroidobacteraceae bacterium]
MTTLTTAPVAPLLAKLFADAEVSTARLRELRAGAPADAARQSQNDYRTFYLGQAKDMHLPVSAETGRLLYMLARSAGARNIVEFGTSFGISTLFLAAALKDMGGGGMLIGTEFEPGKVAAARGNLKAAGLDGFVDIRDGDALQTLARDMPAVIDLVLLDGAKSLYSQVLTLLEPRLRTGALIVADNADMCPEYVARVRAPDAGYMSVAIADDVELSMKLPKSG